MARGTNNSLKKKKKLIEKKLKSGTNNSLLEAVISLYIYEDKLVLILHIYLVTYNKYNTKRPKGKLDSVV